jgi:hypothetical protein
VYDLARFGADIVMDILRTHPLVIIGETLHENTFYMPPDEFLRMLHAREDLPSRAHHTSKRAGR